MTPRFIVMFLILVISCKPKTAGWQTLDFGSFMLKAPSGWTKVTQQGIDSYVGGLTNGKDSLWFDYGWYSVDLTGEGTRAHRYAKDTVNGLSAQIMIPDTAGKGYVSMYIPKVTNKNKFTIWGENIFETATILKIFKTVVFKNSDTLNNPELTISKFVINPHGSGKILFYQNCASCHSITKRLVGPPLNQVIEKRSSEWIYKFLVDKMLIANDSSYVALRKEYEVHCLNFTNLSKEDVDLTVDFIKTE